MKSILSLIVTIASISLLSGCTSFNGQWLEQASADPTQRRAAIEFDGISTVWFGKYNTEVGVVDAQTVQSDTFIVFEGDKTAQFGGILATVDGRTMRTVTAGTIERTFVKVRGKSIFPPKAELPRLSEANELRRQQLSVAALVP